MGKVIYLKHSEIEIERSVCEATHEADQKSGKEEWQLQDNQN